MTETRESTSGAEAPPGDLVPIREAVEIAGVSRRTLENWINAGLLDKYVRDLNRTYVSRGQLLELRTPRKVLPEAGQVVPSED
jgi:hypothetical protein